MAETFGRYQLLKKIATGGMAEIYLARQQGLEGFEKLLVLKRILPHLAENEEFVEMFLHEARVAVRLNHPNIVQIYDLGESDGSFFIAMEYIHGEDARKVWKQADACGNSIPVPLVCRIVQDAAAGLDYAHKKSDQNGNALHIIHRDVSPQNILVSFEGAVKVVDFGIAKAADQATVTRSGVLKGKYSYMSPEQASGKEIDQRTDQFALGIVLWELLTCRRLFKRGTDIQTLAAVTECKIELPSRVNPRVPVDLDAIVMKALARDADDRYTDLRGLQLALEEWLVAGRHNASGGQLSNFLTTVYAERLATEKQLGHPDWDEASDSGGSSSQNDGRPVTRRRGTNSKNQAVPKAQSSTRAGRPSGATPRPVERQKVLEIKSGEFEQLQPPGTPRRDTASTGNSAPTPIVKLEDDHDDGGTITGSSVSRLVVRLSNRKKAAIGVGLTAAVCGLGGALVMMQPGNTAISHNPDNSGTVVVIPTTDKAPVAQGGALKIITNPPGATVSVDALKLEGRTPLTVPLPLGDHSVYLELDGYLDEKRDVTLAKERDIQQLRVDLKRETQLAAKLAVTVDSEPEGAEIFVNGRTIGRTPVTSELAGGRVVEVEARLEGYSSQKRSVTLATDAQKLAFTLERKAVVALPSGAGFGTLSIKTDPKVMVWEGSKQLGESPLKVKLAAGKHQIRFVSLDIGLEYNANLALKADENLEREWTFERGTVQVVVSPVGLGAEIFYKNKKLGEVPGKPISLAEGELQLTVVNQELQKKKTVSVSVTSGKLTKLPVNLGD